VRDLVAATLRRHLLNRHDSQKVFVEGNHEEKPGPKKGPVAPAVLVTAEDRAQPEWPVSSRILRSFDRIHVNDPALAQYPNHDL
jgi:hypothetical protein